jgi:hypothetical protein
MKLPHVPGLGERSRTRYTGGVTLCLFAGTALGALFLANARHLGTASTLVAVLVGGGAPAGLYLAWATYRDSGAKDSVDVRRVADEFAVVVREQWEEEAAARRLNDPYPLPVRWVPADPALVDSWQVIQELATSGAGHTRSRGGWASVPGGLAGVGNELADALERVPTKRLVVLGEPGAGKTMLVVRLLLDLIGRRSEGNPVPVLVSAAAWDPMTQGLHEWLVGKLSIDYPALTAPVSSGKGERSCLEALLSQRMITVLLDGLDEIPDKVRGHAISRINDAARLGDSLVVTSRTAPYRDSVHASGGVVVTLRGAAGIELCPLDPVISGAYLQSDAGGSVGAARWAPVLDAGNSGGLVAGVLSSPLMVGLARVIYNPRPGERLGDVPDPADLLGFKDRAEIDSHLFDGFVPASYRPSPRAVSGRSPWNAQSAERWLLFLASHLENSVASTDLGWWQLTRAMPRGLSAAVTGLIAGLLSGLSGGLMVWASVPFNGTGLGLVFGSSLGFSVCCLSAVVAWRRAVIDQPPSRGVRWRFIGGRLAGRRTFGLVFGLVFGLLFGLSFGGAVGYSTYVVDVGNVFRLPSSLWIGAGLGVLFALIVGLVGVLSFSLEEVPADISSEVTPRVTLIRDRNATLISGLSFGVSTAVTLAIALPRMIGFVDGFSGNIPLGFKGMLMEGWSVSGVYGEPDDQLLRLRVLLAVSLAVSGWIVFSLAASRSAWPRWLLARSWLAAKGQVPWRLVAFLADAHKRGVVRQQGAVYQFRHIELQRRLAATARSAGEAAQARFSGKQASRGWVAVLAAATAIAASTAFYGVTISARQSQSTAIPPAEWFQVNRPPPGAVALPVKTAVIFTCTGAPAVRPGFLQMACATGQEYLSSMHWTKWTDSAATGEGEYAADNCVPDCAGGKFIDNPVLVYLADPRAGKHGVRYFTKMVINGPSIFSFSLKLGYAGADLY